MDLHPTEYRNYGVSVWLAVLFVAVMFELSPARASEYTFSRDVAPILQNRCQECHRPNQLAPMSLLTYEQARPWAKSIKQAVATKTMPPFYAAGPRGYFKDDMRLTEEEIETIVGWVDSGAPRGNPAHLPEPIAWSDSKWTQGEPDMVLTFPPHHVKPDNVDEEVNLYSEHVFEEETWIKGVELATGRNLLLHHCAIFVGPPGTEIPESRKSGEEINFMEFLPIHTWFPGLYVPLLPDGQALVIPKGSRIVLRAHFAPSTERREQNLELGVYLANDVIDTPPGAVNILGHYGIKIPPHEPAYTKRAIGVFREDAYATHFRIHMHVRGKSSKFFFHYPNGEKELVFDLPRYSFDWQRYYTLSEPKFVPKDTIVEVIGVWDNSADNPNNPDPTKKVLFGPRTVDEMFGASVYYTPDRKLEEALVVENGHVRTRIAAEPSSED